MKPILAKFYPQAWVNDYAIDVDPEGDTEWDATPEILAMTVADRIKLKDNSYETDDLQYGVNAPQWVANWSGPFYITVVDDIPEELLK